MARLLDDLDILAGEDGMGFILDSLSTVRRHLNMDISYLGQLRGDTMVFKAVDAPGLEHTASVGESHPACEVYCQNILDCRLPRLMPDTRLEPLAMDMRITRDLPVGSHVGIPIERSDGSIYGMFCSLSFEARPELNPRDLEVAEMFAHLIDDRIDRSMTERERRVGIALRLRKTIRERQLATVYQPIVLLDAGRAAGFEALSRFPREPERPPVTWFDDADEVGMRVELEMAAIEEALGAFARLPGGTQISLNVSPETVLSARLPAALADIPPARVVLEITEHSEIEDYSAIVRALAPLRRKGVDLAVDDSGAGSAGAAADRATEPGHREAGRVADLRPRRRRREAGACRGDGSLRSADRRRSHRRRYREAGGICRVARPWRP